MKRSDISDREALEACWPYADTNVPGAIPLLEISGAIMVLQESGWPFKVALRKLEQLYDRHLIECGVSLNYPWRTPAGEAELARLHALSANKEPDSSDA